MFGAAAAHLWTPASQRNVEQFFGRLAHEVGVQHSHFTDVPQPVLRRRLPETFSDLEHTHRNSTVEGPAERLRDTRKVPLYPLLIVKDLLEPAQVLLLERHQDHKSAGLVVQVGVVRSRLGVEEPHGGLVPHVVLIASHRGVVQPDTGRPAKGSVGGGV